MRKRQQIPVRHIYDFEGTYKPKSTSPAQEQENIDFKYFYYLG